MISSLSLSKDGALDWDYIRGATLRKLFRRCATQAGHESHLATTNREQVNEDTAVY
jgi:hypothetical protein